MRGPLVPGVDPGINPVISFFTLPRKLVMRGLDPRICHKEEMAGSSPAMTTQPVGPGSTSGLT